MLSYLEKYNNLPSELKEGVSTPVVIAAITELEKKYDIELAAIVMRVMVREISIVDLPKYFVFEHGFDGKRSEELVKEMKEKVFYDVSDYLGFSLAPSLADLGAWAQADEKETTVRGSNFFFSPEDEEEVQNLAKKLGENKQVDKARRVKNEAELLEKAKKTVEEMHLNFSSEDLTNRYIQVIQTYIRGVRNRVDTVQTLMKDVSIGGLGLNEVLAAQTVQAANEVMAGYAEASSSEPLLPGEGQVTGQGPTTVEDKAVVNQDIPYDFSQLTGNQDNILDKATDILPEKADIPDQPEPLLSPGDLGVSELESVNQKIHPVQSAKTKAEESEEPLIEEVLPAQTKDKPVASKQPVISETPQPPSENESSEGKEGEVVAAHARLGSFGNITPAALNQDAHLQTGKVKMEDVKYMPKLTGPVDELREMDLINFRRLDSDPDIAIKKIKEKISFLEKDSYAKRLEGIKAWRESPINKIYLTIGQESIDNHKSIQSMIEELVNKGKEHLSNREFSAIMNLNNDLRF